ncbi:LOW QUALITY PROTEIN: hypothetical protein TorRG33x02_237080 [Trema orientale]|uniref:Uncharacterized protein n=1 Tax=Trema orientale TaxID=63057 RepID=A0A2P5E035_TREOI|nr:LOW QUALITY PROTEIN: hypothetical protein TorRG33x02_237080 [Trema orientale]
MTTKTIDERLNVVEERLFEICTECHRTLALIKMALQRISKLEQGLNTSLNKISILEQLGSHEEERVNPEDLSLGALDEEFLCSSCSHLGSTEKLGPSEWGKGAQGSEFICYGFNTVNLDSLPIILRRAFEHAVPKQLMIDAPFRVLLFGGLTLSQVNSAKEISALVIGYMEFGKLEFVGKMFLGCDHQTSTLRTR